MDGSAPAPLTAARRRAGMYHDVCGTLNGRCLGDGTLLYGCTCNLSITAPVLGSLEFDTGFPDAAFEVRARGPHARQQAGVWAPGGAAPQSAPVFETGSLLTMSTPADRELCHLGVGRHGSRLT